MSLKAQSLSSNALCPSVGCSPPSQHFGHMMGTQCQQGSGAAESSMWVHRK